MVIVRILLLLAFAAPTFGAETTARAVTLCDRLAAHPEDPDRVSPGIARDQIDLNAAIAACEQQVRTTPADARSRYELARVLFYAGRNADAVPEMQRAADLGYRQAQFVYGAMISNGRDVAPKDFCIVERYWRESARAGRQAARISYIRHSLNGRFAACPQRADLPELRTLLDAATKEARDYYERLLVEDLNEKLDSTTRRP